MSTKHRHIIAPLNRTTILWAVDGEPNECEIHHTPCPFCGKRAIVALPAAIVAEQPDDTTAVCHPALGGCKQGFAANVGNPGEHGR